MKILTNLSKMFSKTCASFTLLVLAFTIIMYAPANGDVTKYLAPTAPMILSILLFSFIFSLTELLFDNWKLGESAKRIVHFLLNFVNLWLSFFLVSGRVKQVKEFIIMSFLYMIVYIIVNAIASMLRKAKEKLR